MQTNHQTTAADLSGWAPFAECKTVIAEHGEARVYFVAVDCQRRPGAREALKMQRWAEGWNRRVMFGNARVVYLLEEGYSSKGTSSFPRPAVKVTVRSAGDFAQIWAELSKIPNSSCGCSIVVNDAQGFDVRVMRTDLIAYGDRS